jgi:hypothetical protein
MDAVEDRVWSEEIFCLCEGALWPLSIVFLVIGGAERFFRLQRLPKANIGWSPLLRLRVTLHLLCAGLEAVLLVLARRGVLVLHWHVETLFWVKLAAWLYFAYNLRMCFTRKRHVGRDIVLWWFSNVVLQAAVFYVAWADRGDLAPRDRSVVLTVMGALPLCSFLLLLSAPVEESFGGYVDVVLPGHGLPNARARSAEAGLMMLSGRGPDAERARRGSSYSSRPDSPNRGSGYLRRPFQSMGLYSPAQDHRKASTRILSPERRQSELSDEFFFGASDDRVRSALEAVRRLPPPGAATRGDT